MFCSCFINYFASSLCPCRSGESLAGLVSKFGITVATADVHRRRFESALQKVLDTDHADALSTGSIQVRPPFATLLIRLCFIWVIISFWNACIMC